MPEIEKYVLDQFLTNLVLHVYKKTGRNLHINFLWNFQEKLRYFLRADECGQDYLTIITLINC